MKLESATITGSYAGPRVEIPVADLGDAALVAVTGDNGTGKTTTLEAIAPGAIYLRSPSRGQLYDVIREKDGKIEAVWSVNGTTRKHRVLVDAVSKRTEAYLMDDAGKVIAGGKVKDYEAAIGKTYPPYITYLASAFGAQGGKGRFLDLAPAERKVLFAQMIGAGRLDELAETAGTKAREEKQKLERARGKVEGLGSRTMQAATTEQIAEQREKVERLGRTRVALEEGVETDRKALEAWTLKDQALSQTKTTKVDAKTTATTALETAEKPATDARYELGQIEARLSKKDELALTAKGGKHEAEALKAKVDALDKAETDHNHEVEMNDRVQVERREAVRRSMEDLRKAVEQAKRLEDVPCKGEGEYSDCALIASAQKAKATIKELHAKVATASEKATPVSIIPPDLSERAGLKEQLATATAGEKEASDARESLAALAEAETRVDALKQKILAADETAHTQRAALRAVEIEVEEITERYEAHTKSKPLAPDTTELDTAKEDEKTATHALTEMETAAKDAERVKADLATARAEEKHAAEETDDWIAGQKAVRKIKTLEIDAAGPEVSEITNELLHACYGTRYTVKLITQEAKAQKGKGMKETFDLQILDAEKGTESGASKKSTGEKVVINEAFSSAIMVYNNRKSGTPIEDIFRDEFDDGINPARIPGVVRMMRKTVGLVGAHRMYCITHNPLLAELCDGRLEFKGGKVVAA